MKSMVAEDVLQSSTLTLSLPTRALDIPAVARLVGATGFGSKAPRRGPASPVATALLHSVDWEWEEETFEYFDDGGNKETRDIRTELAIDDHRVANLTHVQRRTCAALQSLGIPFDCELFDGLDGSTNAIVNARLDPANPLRRSQDASPQGKPSFDEILDLARKAGSLEDFKEWLEGHADDPRSLKTDAEAFNAMVDAQPDLAPFIEAAAQLIHWAESPSYRPWGGHELKKPKELAQWLGVQFEGESCIRRLGREGLPISMPSMVQMLGMVANDAAIDEGAAGDVLCAYCEAWARLSRPGSAGSFVSSVTARALGEALSVRPAMACHLSPAAKSYFDVPLEKMDERTLPKDYALAEALWLRAQSIVAAPRVASARKVQTL